MRTALSDAADYLRSIIEQTYAAMNEGLQHDEIVARVKAPASSRTVRICSRCTTVRSSSSGT